MTNADFTIFEKFANRGTRLGPLLFTILEKKLLTENKTEQFNIYKKYKKNAETHTFDTLALYLPNKIKI